MFNQSAGLCVKSPQVVLISQGYHYWVNDTRSYVRIFHYPYVCMYRVKVKLPKHKTLHLWWPAAHFFFEGDWLVFDVLAAEWLDVEYSIQKVFNSIYFE